MVLNANYMEKKNQTTPFAPFGQSDQQIKQPSTKPTVKPKKKVAMAPRERAFVKLK